MDYLEDNAVKKIVILFVFASVMLLAACAAPGGAASPAADTPTAGVVNTNYDNALPVPSQLALGTIMLKSTADEVTAAQAAELLPLWQAVQSLTNATSSSTVEFEALVIQIQQTMNPAQLDAIANLKITQESMATAFQTLNLNNFPSSQNGTPVARTPGATRGGGNGNGGFDGPPGGGFIIEGGPGGIPGGFGGGGFGGFPTGTVSPSIRATAEAQATARAQFGNPILYNAVVTYLTQVAGQ
jgi:hypothetical protein